MSERGEKIEKLERYFEKREDVVMAFLFGSRVKGAVHAHSDWDIAVYFKPEDKFFILPPENHGRKTADKRRQSTKRIEENQGRKPLMGGFIWSESDEKHLKYFEERRKTWGDCVDILGTDRVDVIVLNNASATLADEALKGTALVIKNKSLWLEFMLRITNEARDFRELAKGYFEIFWRSASLSPEDAFSLNRRLAFIENELKVIKNYKDLVLEEYKSDLAKRSIVERSIEKIMNAVIDLSKIVLASNRKPIPEKYREIVQALGLFKPFLPDNAAGLSQWVDLRNFLAHEYLDYRWQEISDFLANAVPHLEKLIESARQFLKETGPT